MAGAKSRTPGESMSEPPDVESIRARGGRGVPAFLLAHEAAGLDLRLRQQCIHQRRFADAGLADQHAHRVREQGAQFGESSPVFRGAGHVRVTRGRVGVDFLGRRAC